MSENTSLPDKLRGIRTGRNWSVDLAAKQMDLHPYVLRRLEEGRTLGPRVTAHTVSRLVRGYWPELQWADFMDGDPIHFEPDGKRAVKQLNRDSLPPRPDRKAA